MFDSIFWEMLRGWRHEKKDVGYRKHHLCFCMTPVISAFPSSTVSRVREAQGHATGQFYARNCLDGAPMKHSVPLKGIDYS